MRDARAVDALRLGLGLGILARPELPLRLCGGRAHQHERAAVRILGGRYVAQAVMGLAATRSSQHPAISNGRRPWVQEVDIAIEVLHAGTMLALTLASPRHRRLALLSAVTALGLSALDLQEVVR
jgi:hypothetical protein